MVDTQKVVKLLALDKSHQEIAEATEHTEEQVSTIAGAPLTQHLVREEKKRVETSNSDTSPQETALAVKDAEDVVRREFASIAHTLPDTMREILENGKPATQLSAVTQVLKTLSGDKDGDTTNVVLIDAREGARLAEGIEFLMSRRGDLGVRIAASADSAEQGVS
jgi:hypothetical protein